MALLAASAVTQAAPITPEATITGNRELLDGPGMLGFSPGAGVLQFAGGLRLNSHADCRLTRGISMPWSTPSGGSVTFHEFRTGSGGTNVYSDGTPSLSDGYTAYAHYAQKTGLTHA